MKNIKYNIDLLSLYISRYTLGTCIFKGPPSEKRLIWPKRLNEVENGDYVGWAQWFFWILKMKYWAKMILIHLMRVDQSSKVNFEILKIKFY